MKKYILVSGALIFLAVAVVARSGGDQARAEIPDRDIRVLSFESMRYPAIARAANVHGIVVARVTLDKNGSVTGARALSGGPLLLQVVVDNVKKWRFEANAENAAIVVYRFRIVGLCAHNEDSSQFVLEPPNLALVTACAFTVQTSSQK